MARFYAKFDAGTVGYLDSGDYFNKLRIHSGSSSAALYRDGLLASRSLLSADVYDDLDSVNQNAGIGTFFPIDSASTNIPANFVSWSTAFTSSVPGIKTPTELPFNDYGSDTFQINYSLRPTASISYSSSLVTPTTPLDPIKVSYTTYYSASQAVVNTLNTIQTTQSNNTLTTPYTRPGNFPSRTVHSIWHDPTMSYFAWDDFTPGTPVLFENPSEASNLPCTGTPGSYIYTPTLRFAYAGTYKNDLNPYDGTIRIQAKFTYAGIGVGAGSTATPLDITINVTGSTPYGSGYRYDLPYNLIAGTDNWVNVVARVTMSFYDAKITSSRGPLVYNDALGIQIQCPNGGL